MKGYIYALASKHEDNIFYIGSSISPQTRVVQHMADNRPYIIDPISGEIERPPIDKNDFILSIIDKMEFIKRKELLDLEMYWIHQFYAWGFKLKNNIKNSQKYRFGVQYQMTLGKTDEIRNSNEKNHILAKRYGISITTVSHIKNNKIWRHPIATQAS